MSSQRDIPDPSSSPGPRTPSPFLSSPYGSPAQPTVPQIPLPASHTQTPNYGSPRAGSPFLLRPDSASGAPPSSVAIEDLSDAEKAARVKRHLRDAGEQRATALSSGIAAQLGESGSESQPEASSKASSDDGEYPTPYSMPGGDIVAPIYKWANQQASDDASTSGSAAGGTPALRRSKSLLSITSSSRRVSHSGHNLERPNLSFAPTDDTDALDDTQIGRAHV